MFNPDKIRRLFEDRKISQAQFLKDTSISKSNLYVSQRDRASQRSIGGKRKSDN